MTSAVLTNGAATAQSWSLTYDEDNHTASILWKSGPTNTYIVNRYDALGRRISKTVGGATTGYLLSLVGGMERILCDVDSAGNVTAWYVHGPDLCYRVDAASNVVCYHADAMANIISVTGSNGTTLAQYAYTPYGRTLASTNLAPGSPLLAQQPYKFVGSQGVMEELPGLFFIRARYSAADAGVFLSTDPAKHIGPGWKPIAYDYSSANPVRSVDPAGTENAPLFLAFDAISLNYIAANGTLNELDYASCGAGAVTTIAIVGLPAVSAPIAVPLGILATAVGAI
jgi:RHS repeat-associated protein